MMYASGVLMMSFRQQVLHLSGQSEFVNLCYILHNVFWDFNCIAYVSFYFGNVVCKTPFM